MILDNTMLSGFHSCPKQFYWRHVRNLVPTEDKRVALTFGTAFHSALETFYKGGSQDDALISLVRGFPLTISDDKRSTAVGLVLLEGYFKKWLPEHWEILQVETNLQFELSSDLVYCGKVDLIVKDLGEVHIVDHKTTSSSLSNFIAKPNHQFSGYIYGTRCLGFPTVGAYINLIAVMKTKQDYHRIITHRTDLELEQWRLDVLKTKGRIDDSLRTGHWETQTVSCRMCVYRDLCSSPPETLQLMIDSKYKEEKWQPWNQTDVSGATDYSSLPV